MKKNKINVIVYFFILAVFTGIYTGCTSNSIKTTTGYKMKLVNPGTFMMGSNFGKGYEKPVHQVTLTRPFYIGVYEVTYKEYENYSKETGKDMPVKEEWVRDNSPIVFLTWYDAVEYCNWLSKKEGLPLCYTINNKDVVCNFDLDGYRLPTEAEWDWAAQGECKSRKYKFCGSNSPDESGWYLENPWYIDKKGRKTHIIGKKAPNEIGLYDMSGSVWEWCYDWRGDYTPEPQTNPTGPATGQNRILRGGSWENFITCMRVTNRYSVQPEHNFLAIGFRYARTKKEK